MKKYVLIVIAVLYSYLIFNMPFAYANECPNPVKVNSNYFYPIQDAYNGAADGDTVQITEGLFDEDILLNLNITTIFKGGYNCQYNAITGYSTINGLITITNGTVTVKSLIITATASTNPTYSISGTVSGAVVSDVTVTLTGIGSSTTATDASGNYSFSGVANGNYKITPSKNGFSFSPSSINITVNSANLTGQNFMAETPLDSWQLRYEVPGVYQRAVTYAMGKFFSVGTGGRRILTSPDGITWNEVFVINSNDNNLNAITYANNRLVSVGHFGKVTYSLDGVTWTNLTIPPRNITIPNGDILDLESITYGNNTFVAVGYYGTIVTSPDGITWTHRKATATTPYTNATLYGVTYGNNKFVAVGYNYDNSTDVFIYVVLTSSDGMIWDSCTSCIKEKVFSITYGNNIFVAVGPSDNISTSIDGKNWMSRPSGTFSGTPSASNPSNYFNFITYENNEFIAVGSKILNSTDGITWSKHSAYSSGLYEYGAAYGNNSFIIVGDAGIYQSGPINSQ